MKRHVRWAVLATLALCASAGMTGCATESATRSTASASPWFETPIGWGESVRETPTGGDYEIDPVRAEFLDSTHAQLKDFPQGKTVTAGNGTECLKISDAARYSGPATWSNVNGATVGLKFAGSSVVVASDHTRFGLGQDWTDLNFVQCGKAKFPVWDLGLVCGNPGYGGKGKVNALTAKPCEKDQLDLPQPQSS